MAFSQTNCDVVTACDKALVIINRNKKEMNMFERTGPSSIIDRKRDIELVYLGGVHRQEDRHAGDYQMMLRIGDKFYGFEANRNCEPIPEDMRTPIAALRLNDKMIRRHDFVHWTIRSLNGAPFVNSLAGPFPPEDPDTKMQFMPQEARSHVVFESKEELARVKKIIKQALKAYVSWNYDPEIGGSESSVDFYPYQIGEINFDLMHEPEFQSE